MKVLKRVVLIASVFAFAGPMGCSGSGAGNDAGYDATDGLDGQDQDIACTDISDCPISNLCLDGVCQIGTVCKSSADCPVNYSCLILKEVCVPDNPCTKDDDCAAPTPFCLTGGGVCVACKQDGDCETGYFCNDSHECEIEGPDCTSDADCTESGKPFCDTNQGKCYPCVQDSNCSPQVCEPSMRQCVDCYQDAQCTSGNPYCLPDSHVCVACRDDNDCSGNERCSLAHQCTTSTCANDSDCSGTPNTPHCKIDSGDCVQCTADDHCGTYQWCRDYICAVGCETDAECIDKQGAGYHCDSDTKSCYYAECLTDADCQSASPDLAHCKTASNPSNNACVECTADEHCDEFFYCQPGENACAPEPCYRYNDPDATCQQIDSCYHCDYMSGNCGPTTECTYPGGDECCPGYNCESYGCEMDLNCSQQDPVCANGYECNTSYNQCEWISNCQPPCGAGEFCNSDNVCESGCHEAGETCDPFSTNSCCSGLMCNPFWPFCS